MTLTEARRTFLNALKFGWLIIFLPIVVRIIYNIITTTSPTPTDPEQSTFDALFGKLPALVIENTEILPSTPTFKLDLIDATFPTADPIVKIYPILSAPYGFLSRDRATNLAGRLSFTNEPQVLEDTTLIWRDITRTLTMNPSNLNFTYSFDYTSDLSIFKPGNFGSDQFALNTANDIMGRLGIISEQRGLDLQGGNKEPTRLRYDGTSLVQASTLSQTSALRVDYFRQPIEEIDIVSPQFYLSSVMITISSVGNRPQENYYPQIIGLDYIYWEINRNRSATYPIMTAEQAYSLLQQNFSRYITYLGEKENPLTTYDSTEVSTIIIKEASLGYYDTAVYQQYLQPVWVFIGTAALDIGRTVDFVTYVPAIQSEWIQ